MGNSPNRYASLMGNVPDSHSIIFHCLLFLSKHEIGKTFQLTIANVLPTCQGV
jgi:hypothetical protein